MDEIVMRLRKKRAASSIRESFNSLREADEDEEEVDTSGGTEEEEEPVDFEGEDAQSDTPAMDTDSDSVESEEEDGDYVDPDGDTEAENQAEGDTEEDNEYVNPLDNQYAVKHTIGDEVILAYSNGTKSKLKGEIEGYDKEGFYRIRWSNGLTTDGITDLALAGIATSTRESKCVCGNSEFVNEGKNVVCDRCGRKIRESKEDPLTVADRMRPAGKRMIRSEAHPISTSIGETIKNAFKSQRKSINEDKIPDIFSVIGTKLGGEFWTRKEEMKDDIEDLGFLVEEINDEYVIVSGDDYEEELTHAILIPIGGTSRTMTLDFDRARSV